ncbi:methyltransferase domain-containing protein, partial [Patescibacteria group bacterium]|nr:methyltransferase domain-containing protein [Patescibacteria group bacterium]
MSVHFSEPRENVARLKLRPGIKVADLGAGTGHYARSAAALVGRDGRVYAVDIQEGVLQHARLNMPRHGEGVVEYVWGDIERAGGTKIRDHALDAAMLANCLFQIEDRQALIKEIRRILKEGGKLLVVDWAGSYSGMGPAPEAVVTEHAAEKLFLDAGFHKEEAFRAGP